MAQSQLCSVHIVAEMLGRLPVLSKPILFAALLPRCVILVRLEEAKRLLRTTTQPVADIGYAIGYQGSNYLAEVFKATSKKLDNKAQKQYTGGIKNVCSQTEHYCMGQATRTTKLLLHLGKRDQGGANTNKQAALTATVEILNGARAFYLDFFLAHADKLAERVPYYSEKHLEMRERSISANELLSWAEACTVETEAHPHPSSGWNFSARFPDLPFIYRRSVIKDAIGKVRSYLSQRAQWEKSGKKKGKPGLPGATDHPTLYQGTCSLQLESADVKQRFVQRKRLRWQDVAVGELPRGVQPLL